MEQENKKETSGEGKMPPAPTGNASNPSPQEEQVDGVNNNQLLGGRAEKYLRESASPEDYPDEQDWENANKILDGGPDKS